MQRNSTDRRTLAFVFDMDGVLVDSAPLHWRAFRATLEEIDPDIAREFTYAAYMLVGLGAAREVVLERVLGRLSPDRLRELMEAKERHTRRLVASGALLVIPGALEFVAEVRRHGLKAGVATASRTPHLFLDAAGFHGRFDVVLDRTASVLPKPSGGIYRAAAAALGIEPCDCLAVEDSPIGVAAALDSGMRVLALATNVDPAELANATAVYPGFAAIRLDEWL